MEQAISENCIDDEEKSCNRCLQGIKTNQFLKCCLCLKYYDLLCTNVSETRFYSTMTPDHKSKWRCEKCLNNYYENEHFNASDKCEKISKDDESVFSNVTLRKRSTNIIKTSDASGPSSDKSTISADYVVIELRLLREEMKAARAEMQEFRSAISGLTSAVNTCNRRIDELAERVDAVETQQREGVISTGTDNIIGLEQTIADLKLELNDRDQEMLSNDVEIAGIPEEINERSMHLVLAVARKLDIKLEERDVVSAERAGAVRRADSEASRPRPIVVRLARRALRDDLLAAARVRRDTTTAGIGIAAADRRVYVNERLTRTNRQIFYKARSESKRANWKYVWTRDGKIFARKEHGSMRHRLRSEVDIIKIFG